MILEMGGSIQVELIEIRNAPHNELMPSFVSGQNACPPEDCWGPDRYSELSKILADPSHEVYESVEEWLGPKFNPNKLNRIKIEKESGILAAKIKGYEKGFI